jgi:hypothetical protein
MNKPSAIRIAAVAPAIFVLAGLPGITNGQDSRTDTLSYFSPDKIQLSQAWIGAIDSFAVHIEPILSSEYFEISELLLQLSPYAESTPGDSFTTELRIRKAGRADGPGSLLLNLPISIKSSETYPNWKKVDLTSYPEVKSLQGDFWLEGYLLAACVASEATPGHSFAHNAHGFPYWYAANLEFGVKAIITRIEPTGVMNDRTGLNNAPDFNLHSHPSPFHSSTTISFTTAHTSTVSLEVYDLIGRRIKTLLDRQVLSGQQGISWDGNNDSGIRVVSGNYFYRLQVGQRIQVGRMIFLR